MDISLLLEHKSTPDRNTPVQIGSYLFSGYQQQIKYGRKQLSPIIPILFYHGKQKWEYWTLDRLFDLDDDLLGYIPKYNYIYHNLRDLPEETIRAIGNQFLASSLLMLKYAFDKRGLKVKFSEILSLGLSGGSEDQGMVLAVYGFELMDYKEAEIKDIIKELPMNTKEKFVSLYDRLKMEAREQVEEQAYAEKLRSAFEFKKMGICAEDIAKGLQLPIEEVEKL